MILLFYCLKCQFVLFELSIGFNRARIRSRLTGRLKSVFSMYVSKSIKDEYKQRLQQIYYLSSFFSLDLGKSKKEQKKTKSSTQTNKVTFLSDQCRTEPYLTISHVERKYF